MFIITYNLKDTEKNRDIYAWSCTLSQYKKKIDRKRIFEVTAFSKLEAIEDFEMKCPDCNFFEIEEV